MASDEASSQQPAVDVDRVDGQMPYNATLVRDMADHAWSKMLPPFISAMRLADTPETAFQVAFTLLGQMAGACGGATDALYGREASPENRRSATLAVLDIARQLVAEGPDAVLAPRAEGARP